MLLILLSFKEKLYSYFKVVVNLKFYIFSISFHLVILLTFFNGNTFAIKPEKTEIPIEIKGLSKNTKIYKKIEKEKPKINSSASKISENTKIVSTKTQLPLENRLATNEEISPTNPSDNDKKENLNQVDKEKEIETQNTSISKNTMSEIPNSENDKNTEISSYSAEKIVVDPSEDTNLIKDNDSYYIKNQDVEGLRYKILKSPDPEYPLMAKKANIKEEIIIKVRFSIDEKGKVENVKFYDKVEKYGYREEVVKALENWSFTPITYNNKLVKMYFYKVFIFKIN